MTSTYSWSRDAAVGMSVGHEQWPAGVLIDEPIGELVAHAPGWDVGTTGEKLSNLRTGDFAQSVDGSGLFHRRVLGIGKVDRIEEDRRDADITQSFEQLADFVGRVPLLLAAEDEVRTAEVLAA